MDKQRDRRPQITPPTGRHRNRGQLIAIALYVALSIALYFALAPLIADRGRIQSSLEAAGVWGVLIYLLLYTAQMFVPWLPGAPLDIIGGATFGFWETNFLSTLSASASGLVIFLIVRKIGLETIVERFPSLLDAPWRLVKIIQRQPWSLIAVNMLTGDVAYFVAGAARLPVVFTVIVLGIQRLPSVMIGTALGAGIISNVVQHKLDIMVGLASVGTIIGLLIGFAAARKIAPGWLKRLESTTEDSSEKS
jgi:uncharacterized membrane protein YdjX (TVP38/TMEM64 family)